MKRKATYNLQLTTRSEGFTLIEAVVSVGIFAIAATSIVGVYVSVQRLNRTSASIQAVQQNTRFVSETVTKIIRNGEIDYPKYSCPQPGKVCQPWVGDLYLKDQDGTQIRIFKPAAANYLQMDKQGLGTSQLTGNEVLVLDFRVYIWPQQNPFSGGSIQEQPTVTFFFNFESNINPQDKVRMPFQTTVAVKQYPQ